MTLLPTSALLLLATLSHLLVTPTSAYASWLKCYVELDPSEVVMKHPIVEVEKSDHKVELIVAEPAETEEDLEMAPSYAPNYTWESDDYEFAPDGNTTLFVRLTVPPLLQEEDVQYVVEVTYEGEDGTQSATNDDFDPLPASFTEPIMCDGRRSFSRAYDTPVKLQIDGTQTRKVSLTAAWAKGFEQVSLTETLVLQRKNKKMADEL